TVVGGAEADQLRALWRSKRSRLFRRKGQGKRHARSATVAVFRPDRASVGLDEALRDSQSEARAAARAGPRFVGPPEAVEHPLRGPRPEAVSGVFHRDRDVV